MSFHCYSYIIWHTDSHLLLNTYNCFPYICSTVQYFSDAVFPPGTLPIRLLWQNNLQCLLLQKSRLHDEALPFHAHFIPSSVLFTSLCGVIPLTSIQPNSLGDDWGLQNFARKIGPMVNWKYTTVAYQLLKIVPYNWPPNLK